MYDPTQVSATVAAAQEQIAQNARAQNNSNQLELQPLMGVSTIQTAPATQTANGQEPPPYNNQIHYPELPTAPPASATDGN